MIKCTHPDHGKEKDCTHTTLECSEYCECCMGIDVTPLPENTTNSPYLLIERTVVERKYNPAYGDERVCECGHPYHRHFDGYEDNAPVGCKYCNCWDFKEKE
jgi:hypothetical protein